MDLYYSAQSLKELVSRIGQGAGVPEDDAVLLADALIEADLAGISTHGVSRLAIYVKRMEKGLIDPKAPLRIERRRGCDALGCLRRGHSFVPDRPGQRDRQSNRACYQAERKSEDLCDDGRAHRSGCVGDSARRADAGRGGRRAVGHDRPHRQRPPHRRGGAGAS